MNNVINHTIILFLFYSADVKRHVLLNKQRQFFLKLIVDAYYSDNYVINSNVELLCNKFATLYRES